jgi:iron complex transport system permease protein
MNDERGTMNEGISRDSSSFIVHRSSFGITRPLIILAIALLVVIAIAVSFGAVSLDDPAARTILLRLRLPRVLLAAVIGATLAVAGVTFQTLLRNPLADPFILGVSGGAAAGAAIATALRWARFPGVVPIVAFLGACGATAAVFLLARRRDHTDPTRLLLSGLVLNAFFSAIILIAFSLSRQADLTAALRWMMGNISAATWTDVVIVTAPLLTAMIVLAFVANDLRLLAFGEEDAKARGVDVERVKLIGFGTASIITGAAVAVSGIIGFVGLLVPHLIRLIWRRDFRFLLPLCALGGAMLVVGADLLSRTLVTTAELPIGAFTAILGVPFFLSLLRRER